MRRTRLPRFLNAGGDLRRKLRRGNFRLIRQLLGLSVEHSGEAGIYFEDVEDSRIEGCTTYFSVSSGIGVWYSARIAVRGNTVVNARYDEENGHEESVSVSGTSDFEVSGNEVYLEPGVPCTGGNAAIKVKEGSRRGRVFDNDVHDFFPEGHISLDAWDAGLNGTPTLGTIEFFGNRIVSSGGIRVSSEEDGIVEDVKIYNNLVLFTDNGIMVTDAGASIEGLKSDFDGIERPRGDGIDIGAFEYSM